MTITVAGSTEHVVSSGTPLPEVTVSSVTTGTRTNGYFAVAIMVMTATGASDVTGVTWGGVAMSKRAEAGSSVPYVEWWYILGDAGGTADVVVSFSGTGVTSAHIVPVWGNSDAALSLGDFDGVLGTTEDPASISLDTNETGALCLGAYSTQDNNVATPGDTIIQDHDAGGNCAGSSYLIAGSPGTYVLDWDRNASGISTIFNMAAFEMYEPDTGSPPTVVLDTADETVFGDPTPTVLFTATDPDGDAVTDNFQATNNPDDFVGGEVTTFSYSGGSGTPIHPNPVNFLIANGSSLDGWRQTDDRPVYFATARGGILKEVTVVFGNDEGASCDGTAYVLVYATEGIENDVDDPLRPLGADPDDGGVNSPVPGWLAISDAFPYNPGANETNAARTLTFSGANQIQLTTDEVYGYCLLWRPTADEFDNANTISVTTGTAGSPPITQGWIEGRSANYGSINLLMHLEVVEEFILLDKVSDTDAGFANEDDGGDTDPFTSGDQMSFTVQAGDALDDGVYFCRARAEDPAGTGTYGPWSDPITFTIDTSSGTVINATAVIVAASNTPDDPVLAITRNATTAIAAQSATPDDPVLQVLRSATAAILAASATPDTAVLSVLRQATAVISAGAITPDDITLAVQRAAAAIIQANGQTPDNAQLSILRQVTAVLQVNSATPDIVSLSVLRQASAAILAQTATPDDVDLITATAVGLVLASFAARKPGVTAAARAPGITANSG